MRTLQRVHSVAMDTIVLEVGTVELFPLQGRVVVVAMDMDTLGVVGMRLMGQEQNPQEGVGKELLVGKVAGQLAEKVAGVAEGEVDDESLLVVRYGTLKLWLLSTLEFWHPLHDVVCSCCT